MVLVDDLLGLLREDFLKYIILKYAIRKYP